MFHVKHPFPHRQHPSPTAQHEAPKSKKEAQMQQGESRGCGSRAPKGRSPAKREQKAKKRHAHERIQTNVSRETPLVHEARESASEAEAQT